MSTKLTIIPYVLILLSICACKKKDVDLSNLNDTIIIRHKKADMPAHIHGNASDKTFLIILHGGPGGTGLQYRVNTIKSKIEQNNAVVYFDQRGSGSSQGSYKEADVSVDLMAEDVLALVKVLKAKYGNESKFFLMGHSWGGTLGPAVLLKNQHAFLGWIDVDGNHDPKGSYYQYPIVLKERAKEQINKGNSVDYWNSVLDIVKNVSPTYNKDDFFKLNQTTHKAEEVLADDNIINKSDYGDYTPNFFTTAWNNNQIITILTKKGLYEKVSFTKELHRITIPSFVLSGKYDLIVPAQSAQKAFDNLGSSDKELFYFERTGHSPMFSEPDLFATKVIGFINKHR